MCLTRMNVKGFDVGSMAKRKAFTLIEILIVVSILGILAAVVVPRFSQSSTKAKEAAAKEILQSLRTQMELFKIQHNGLKPGYIRPGLTYDELVILQLCRYSDIDGNLFDAEPPNEVYKLGPYLKDYPKNPFNNESGSITFYDAANEAPPTGSNGWIYNAVTGEIHVDWPGTDSEGVAYYDY